MYPRTHALFLSAAGFVFVLQGSGRAAPRSALGIFNSTYANISNLPGAAIDAGNIGAALTNCGYATAINQNQTIAQMEALVPGYYGGTVPNEKALFYYGGHGATGADQGALIGVDDNPPMFDALYPPDDFADDASPGHPLSRIFFFDSCGSGGFAQAVKNELDTPVCDARVFFGAVPDANDCAECHYVCTGTSDPAKLGVSCVVAGNPSNAFCDGPAPMAGNGQCTVTGGFFSEAVGQGLGGAADGACGGAGEPDGVITAREMDCYLTNTYDNNPDFAAGPHPHYYNDNGGEFGHTVLCGPEPGAPNGGQTLAVTLNEDCTGTYRLNGGPVMRLPCFQDPMSVPPNAPTFILPVSVAPGDVRVREGCTGPVSDLLRFPEIMSGISDRVRFFSEATDPAEPGDLSDVGLPPTLQRNVATVIEPPAGFAVWMPSGSAAMYEIRSDPVPTHLQCYEVDHTPKNIPVTLVNQFGASTATLVNIKRLCNPADKNGEDPAAPGSPGHYVGYTLRQTSARFRPVRGYTVKNQFGTFLLKVVRPLRLLVPSSKDLNNPPPPLDSATAAFLDHFECYRVSGARGAGTVTVQDEFGMGQLKLLKGEQVCVAVDKNGEGIPDPGAKLLCYKTRRVVGGTLHGPRTPLFVNNQFGPDTFIASDPHEFCVPSSPSGAFLDRSAMF